MLPTPRDSACTLEQAKGVIMLRYGVSSCESLATIARWAHEAHVTVPEMAHALVKGICQGRVTAENRGVVRWLEHRLRADIGETRRAPETVTLRPSTGTGTPPPPPPTRTRAEAPPATDAAASTVAASSAAAARQWRYASAVHAARAVGSP